MSELARQLGINRTQFNRYLSGESFPRPDVLDRICLFFNVDARILLEPAEQINAQRKVIGSSFLKDFLGMGVADISENFFPSGFYRFSRRSFVMENHFVLGLVHVFRRDNCVFVRGYETAEALRQEGLLADARSREYRGYASRQDDGIAFITSRRNSTSCSMHFVARVASFENNYWAGFVARTVRENAIGPRVTRMVYEHLGRDIGMALDTARMAGFVTEDQLLPYHRRLLRTQTPFR